MFGKNIANYSTFNTLLINRLEIQNSGSGLIIYSQDPNNPEFSFSTADGGDFKMSGSLTVTGDASFENIDISEFDAGLIALSATNAGDTIDIGLYGKYNDGTEKYSGIARDANDTLKRWTFFKDIETQPTATISGIDSTKLDSVRMDRLFINNGSISNPSLAFHNDTGLDSGFYLAGADDIGITAGGANVVNIRNSGAPEVEFNQATEVRLLRLGTGDDTTSANPSITTGNIYLSSSDASDRWFKYYSTTTAPTPSYAGTVYTSPTTNFFMFNSGSSLVVSRNVVVSSASAPPDYRNTSSDLITISATQAHFNQTIRVGNGSVSTPGIVFSEANTGIYRNTTNQISVANNGSNSIIFAETAITSARPILYPNGAVGTPAFGFTAGTQTGLYRDTGNTNENISISASGVKIAGFQLRTTPQLTVESSGSASIPSLAWGDYKSGFYSPASNQISLSLNETEITCFRPRSGTGAGSIDLLNSTNIKSDGVSNTHILNENHLLSNVIKASGGSFHGYNLVDDKTIAIYSFRSDNIIGKDYSTNGIDLTAVNSPTFLSVNTDGNSILKKDVLDLAGNTNKFLQITNLDPFRVDRITISFWFRITGVLTTDNVIMSFFQTGGKKICIKVLADGASFPNALQLTVNSDVLNTLEYHTATSADPGFPSIISVKDDLWHHVVYTIGTAGDVNPKVFMYYDGVELDVATSTLYTTSNGDNIVSPKISTNSFDDLNFNAGSIGALYDGITASEFFTGYLKDIYFTNRHISAEEVSTLGTDPFTYFYGIDVARLRVADFSSSLNTLADGSAVLPSLSFSSDLNTGIYKSAEDEISITSGGIQSLVVSNTSLNYRSILGAEPSTRKITLTASSGDTGPRLVFNHSSGATHSIRSNHSTATIGLNYLDYYLYDNAVDGNGLGTHQIMRLGQTSAGSNAGLLTMYGVIRGNISGSASAPIYSFVGATNSGMFLNGSSLAFSTAGTERLSVSSTAITSSSSFKTAVDGSAGTPAYQFATANTGIYGSGAVILFSTGGTFRFSVGSSTITNTLPIRSSNGLESSPSYSFTNSTDSGLYLDSVGVLGLSCGNQAGLLLRNRSDAPHNILNSIDFRPNGTNVRLLVENTKLRASSNQSILTVTPVLYLGFKKNISSLTEQDESINKIAIIATGATYTTNVLDLTDANGVGLLNYGAVVISSGNRIETETFSSILNLMTTYEISVKFKPTSIGLTNVIFEVIGNTSNDVIRLEYNAVSGISILARTNSGIVIQGTSTLSISTNIWYSIKFIINSKNSLTINGASSTITYSIGNSRTSFSLSTFSTDAKAVVGGTANSLAGYYSDFYIAPITTSETANNIFRTQAHELYTNKIQYGAESIVSEGSVLRADAGNNLVWDSSLQITSSAIQLNNSKVLRLPNGSVGAPSVSFISDTNTGIYSGGADILIVSTGGTERMAISTSAITSKLALRIPDGTSLNPAIAFSSNSTVGMYIDGVDWHFTGSSFIFNSSAFVINSLGDAYIEGSLFFGGGGTSSIGDPDSNGTLNFSGNAEQSMVLTPTRLTVGKTTNWNTFSTIPPFIRFGGKSLFSKNAQTTTSGINVFRYQFQVESTSSANHRGSIIEISVNGVQNNGSNNGSRSARYYVRKISQNVSSWTQTLMGTATTAGTSPPTITIRGDTFVNEFGIDITTASLSATYSLNIDVAFIGHILPTSVVETLNP